MKSSNELVVRANKLLEVLGGYGYQINQSESLEVIAKLRGCADQTKADTKVNGDRRQLAEQYLDEMLTAKEELDYAKFTQRMEAETLEEYTEKHFLRGMKNIGEDLGNYVSRKYFGQMDGQRVHAIQGKYPENVRHVWRVTFEHQVSIVYVGLFRRKGKDHVNEILFT